MNNVIIKHFELEHRGMNIGTQDGGIYQSQTDGSCQDITISYCYLHDFGQVPVLTRFTKNWLFEYNYVCRNTSSAEAHSEAWSDYASDDMIVRYNIWADIE